MDFDSTIVKASRSALDPRLATAEEMHSFISEMAPSDFDLTSEAFRSLPTEVQYEIIGDLRLKSRQTSFKRLQNMLKNSETPMDFSKEQIKGLKERNHLTQKLLTTTDSIGKAHVEIPIRIAGERNREYVLVKNEGEGKGWILGMRDVGTRDQPIIVDDPSRDGVKPKEARDKEREEAGSDGDVEMEEVQMLVFNVCHKVPRLTPTFSRPTKQPPPMATIPQDQDPRRHQSRMAPAAVVKRQNPFSRSPPVKSRSGVFSRRPSGSKSGARTAEVPLFVPDEEDDAVPQTTGESEGDEWEDFDVDLEEDVQMSIAIAESLESQRQSRGISDTRQPAQTPAPETPAKPPRQTNTDNLTRRWLTMRTSSLPRADWRPSCPSLAQGNHYLLASLPIPCAGPRHSPRLFHPFLRRSRRRVLSRSRPWTDLLSASAKVVPVKRVKATKMTTWRKFRSNTPRKIPHTHRIQSPLWGLQNLSCAQTHPRSLTPLKHHWRSESRMWLRGVHRIPEDLRREEESVQG
jgi:hypothetical protein